MKRKRPKKQPICISKPAYDFFNHTFNSFNTTGQKVLQTCPSLTKLLPIYITKHSFSGSLPSNSSLLNFFDYVMTFNDSVVDLTCCKNDGTEVYVSCGQGLSCSNACFTRQATLCPSQNCQDCDNINQEEESEDNERGIRRNTKRRQRRQGPSYVTNSARKFKYCLKWGCPVRWRPECCFHPVCKGRRTKKCVWLQAFVGNLFVEFYICRIKFLF